MTEDNGHCGESAADRIWREREKPDLAAVIEAIKRAAYQEGWNDREADLIAGANRIAPQPDLAAPAPISMVLHCPACGKQHIDEATEEWDNPPHRSHLCLFCGRIWRPADVPTMGVAAILTKGANDSPAVEKPDLAAPADVEGVIEKLLAPVRRWHFHGDHEWQDESPAPELHREAAAVLRTLAAENAALRGELKPFVDLAAAVLDPKSPDYKEWLRESKDWMVVFSFGGPSITLGHLRALFSSSSSLMRPTETGEIAALRRENSELRLAICGGEDAPGYADSLSVETILGVLRDNYASWRRDSELAWDGETANSWKARAQAAEAKLAAAEGVLDWFSAQHSLSLEWYRPVYGDDDDDAREWRVYRESGPINDREWEMVGAGDDALKAILDARQTIEGVIAASSIRKEPG